MKFHLPLWVFSVLLILSYGVAEERTKGTPALITSADAEIEDIQQTSDYGHTHTESISGLDLPPKKTTAASKPELHHTRTSVRIEVALPESSTSASLPQDYEKSAPEVTNEAGTFVGKKLTTGAGKNVVAFLGIPYAKPPVGDLRFLKPVPIDKLETPFHAFHLPNACYQEDIKLFPGFSGESFWHINTNASEDCLYLNIWIPEQIFANKKNELVPIMMYIHGGGFTVGSSSLDIYDGAILATEESIIVVSCQYRLGPQGLFFLGTEDAPGNMGLWDQNLALRWVNDNIESFRGDPNAITLFGQSAGSASVGYHLLSPASQIYFKRAVMASDIPGQKYMLFLPEVMRNISLDLAKRAGCDIEKNPKEIMECLRKVDSAILNKDNYPFRPTVDGVFLPDFPSKLLANGEAKKTEIIVGTVNDEGSTNLLYKYANYLSHKNSTSISKERFSVMMKEVFEYNSEVERDAIISYYTNWKNPEDGYLNQAIMSEAFGDGEFVCPMRRWADSWSNRGNKVYYYHFTHRPSTSEWAEWTGVNHSDDVFFFFGHPLNDTSKYTKKEQILSKNFMRLFANFAKTGTPSDNWERYTSEMPVYLDLNATVVSDTTVRTNLGPKADRCAFWNQILPKIGVKQKSMGNNGVNSKSSGGLQEPPNSSALCCHSCELVPSSASQAPPTDLAKTGNDEYQGILSWSLD